MRNECSNKTLCGAFGGDSSASYRQLFDSMQEGFSIHEILCDEENQPVDYRFLEVNPAFEQLTGLKRDCLVGRTVKEVLPNIEQYWIQRYGDVALSGEAKRFEAFTQEIGKHYSIYAYSPGPGMFATLFSDVTDRVRAEEELRKANESLEAKVRKRTMELDAANQDTYKANTKT